MSTVSAEDGHRVGRGLSIGQCATLACLLEATTPKPGNVHRGADFADMNFFDFVVSGTALGPVMESAVQQGVGRSVLNAVIAVRELVPVNTSLGTILLLAPLAAVPRQRRLAEGTADVLRGLNAEDATLVYQAIRRAQPGGLGKAEAMDVNAPPPKDLRAAMQAAAERDLVARQYVNDFQEVHGLVVPSIVERCRAGWTLSRAVIRAHVQLMARHPDSLIARKCGRETAERSAALAARVLEAETQDAQQHDRALSDLDFWLRSDGHRRNPGTTADLIAAALFVVLRENWVDPPWR
jgi:triphosphoribosyl-dephospho-CoA synthase